MTEYPYNDDPEVLLMNDYAKPTVATDAGDTLGTIITDNEKRDAIHLAVEPVVAGMNLRPGDHVKLKDGLAVLAMPSEPDVGSDAIGIVDPFLLTIVEPGDRFWLVVYPRQISSLRHVWEHPAFPPSQESPVAGLVAELLDAGKSRADARAWLADWLSNSELERLSVDQFIEAADTGYWSEPGDSYNAVRMDSEYATSIGYDAYGTIPDAVWHHVETILGHRPANRPGLISCSC